MTANTLRIVSRGKDYSRAILQHLPKLWLRAPVRFELSCAADDDTEAALDAVGEYSITIQGLTASRAPDDTEILWYGTASPELDNSAKSKGPHAIFELNEADIANVADAGEYWIAFHAYVDGERIVRAAGYITFVDDGFPDSPPTPTPPGTVYLTQAAGDARYVRDPGTVTDNAIVRWDGTSGNLVQNSGVTVNDSGDLTVPSTVYIGPTGAGLAIQPDNLTADRVHQAADEDGTLALTDNINGSPDRMEIYVKCAEVGGVTTGQAVYISGASGGNKLITKAIASGESTSSKTIGIVMQNLAHNGSGYVVTEGLIEVSLAAGTAVEGDPVWLSPTTAGGLVYGLANKPSAPYHMVFLGYITRINGGTIAQIYVKVQNGFELEELHNVAIGSPTSKHSIFWNGYLWVNRAISVNDFSGTATAGYVLTVSGGVPTWAAAAEGTGNTNLSFSRSGTTVTVISDTGDDAVIPAADGTNAGVMTSTQFTKLAGIAEGATANVGTVTGLAAGTSGTGVTVTIAGTSAVPTVAVSLGANSVGSSQLADASVTNGKLASGAVSNANLASMLANTIKGSVAGGTPIDLTSAEATSILDSFAGTIKGLVPTSPGGTASYLRADGSWAAPPGGIGGTPGGDTGELQYNNAGAFGGISGSSVSGGSFTPSGVTAIGTGLSPALTLQNPTAATAGATLQNSPSLILEGQAWRTGGSPSLVSVPVQFRQTLLPSSSSSAGGTIQFSLITAGSAVSLLSMAADSGGAGSRFTAGGTIFTNGGSAGSLRLNGNSSTGYIGWSNNAADSTAQVDLYIRRGGSHNLRLGEVDTSVVNAQTISVQSVSSSAANGAGGLFTFEGSRGSGTGIGGDIRFRVAPPGTASNVVNPLQEVIRFRALDLATQCAGAVVAGGPVVLPTYTVSTVPLVTLWTRGLIYVSDDVDGPTPAFSDGTNWRRVADRAVVSTL